MAEGSSFDIGEGWAMEPWNQEEMPVSEELARQAAEQSDLAIVVLGRTAGEDKDNSAAEGSYLLTAAEEEILRNVCNAFARTIVVLNVGNIMDMKWSTGISHRLCSMYGRAARRAAELQ